VSQASAFERTVLPGTRLGRYEIITNLASGGMATVFLGRALGAAGFNRLVAIKLLHPHIAADEQFITMFIDEARLAARIRHPNVVPTLDLQHGPEGHYLVMEFVEGESLLGLLRQTVKNNKPMPQGIAIRIVLDALAGLHAAHELTGDLGEPLHLVHRDVSPHNILVGVDGISRIVDFGVARAEERIGTTRDGQVKGKLAYMAPEQTNNEVVDRRVDVFTAGIVLWEALTAKRLFRGQTDAEVVRNLIDKPIPRLREVSPAFSQELDDVVARALNRTREERFDTALEFAEALEEASETLGVATAKQVGAYVRESAGAVIDDVMRRVRAFQEGVRERRASTPPRLEITDGESDSAVRTSAGAMSAETAKQILAAHDATRSRRPLVIGVAAALLVLVGAVIATVTLLVAQSPTPHASSSTSNASAKTTDTHTLAGNAAQVASPVDSSPAISITDLPQSPTSTTRPRSFGHHASTTAPTTSAAATPAVQTAPTTKPTPTSSAFNPESM
jgi:serine/threonine-protein kinase